METGPLTEGLESVQDRRQTPANETRDCLGDRTPAKAPCAAYSLAPPNYMLA